MRRRAPSYYIAPPLSLAVAPIPIHSRPRHVQTCYLLRGAPGVLFRPRRSRYPQRSSWHQPRHITSTLEGASVSVPVVLGSLGIDCPPSCKLGFVSTATLDVNPILC